MTLQEFDALCQMEWGQGKGQVHKLYLTEDSLRKLQDEMITYGGSGKMLPVRAQDLMALKAGDRPMYIVNPVNRQEVNLHLALDADVAEIWFPDGHFENHILGRQHERA